MNFREAIDLIGDQTARPELDNIIRQRINGFVRMISLSGRYWPDRIESTFSSMEKLSEFTFSLPARFRAFDYILHSDRDKHIDRKEPSQLSRDPSTEVDIYYLAGSNVIIRSARLVDSFRYAYWEYPLPLVKDADTNWIMQLLGPTVVDMTSRVIMGMIGERVEEQFYANLSSAELQIMVEDVLGDHTATVMSGRA